MIGRTNAGGGGGGLNFSVVGGTSQPENPKENTIWVNTQTEISGWVFSATEPESPTEGMVWISTGTSSTVEFNALKKQGIQVYPISAKQYISGAWVNKTAKSYQGGAWKEWIKDLYIDGSEWQTRALAPSSDWSAAKTPSTAKNSDGSTSVSLYFSGSGGGGLWELKSDIDLTGFSKVVLRARAETPSTTQIGPAVALVVMKRNVSYWEAQASAFLKIPNTSDIYEEYTLDISTLNGNYDVAVGLEWSGNWLGNATIKATIYDVRLE